MQTYFVAFWNVENLFDVADAPERPDWLAQRLRNELEGWTSDVLDRKIGQLAQVIMSLNGGRGPDLLGVCEVENRPVLDRLAEALAPLGRPYAVAHADTSDGRGIDVAFLYDQDRFTAGEQFSYAVLKRTATRDLFQVNFTTQQGRELIVIGNHWPSRSGGVYESEPYRILAAETLSYWLSRIEEIKGEDAAILVMGDFNDEPFDRALTGYALSTRSLVKVLRARTPRLFNLMWPPMGQRLGSYYYNFFPLVFDQFLASRGLAKTDGAPPLRVVPDSPQIEMPAPMVSGGLYPDPIRFGRPSSPTTYNPDGFSDHYPISVLLEER